LKFFFDNNLSPHIASAIGELSKFEDDVEQVIHLRQRFQTNAPDTEWVGGLTHDGPWNIVSADRFTKNRDAEREAIRRAGHSVFVLDPQWLRHTYWLQAQRLVGWWPLILSQARLASRTAFRVPWRHTSQAKFEAIKL
jgi:hypothetical protein